MALRFRDRDEAGDELAHRLSAYRDRSGVLVLGIPRGGVAVAYPIARFLGAPLDVFVVRKLGVPGHEELAMGAIASGGVRILNQDVIADLKIRDAEIAAVALQQEHELQKREGLLRSGRPAPPLRGQCLILVDDGLATGASMRAAVAAIRRFEPAELVLAVPVAAPPEARRLRQECDAFFCLREPPAFRAVGDWYEHFPPLTDDDVTALLSLAVADWAASALRR